MDPRVKHEDDGGGEANFNGRYDVGANPCVCPNEVMK